MKRTFLVYFVVDHSSKSTTERSEACNSQIVARFVVGNVPGAVFCKSGVSGQSVVGLYEALGSETNLTRLVLHPSETLENPINLISENQRVRG